MWRSSSSAEATSASGVGPPYLAYSSLSSDPALTPMRRLTPASVAALQMSGPTWSNLRMLPGFTRTAAQPASMAWNTYFDWKWMSAMIGIGDLATICGKASASSWLGTATRTMSQPAAVSSAILWLQRGRHVRGERVGHRLHGDGGAAADRHRPDHDATAICGADATGSR